MSSAAQVMRQAESLKATITDSGKSISELWVTRQRLEDLYKRLLLMDLEYALDKKVEQDLWNHAFKNQITTLQTQAKDKHNPKKTEVQANLNLFLETASGFFLQFLQLLCSTFKLDLPFRRKSAAFGVMKENCPMRTKITPPKKSSCLYICQYCLVHLGDIARYRQQVEQAQTYYRHAVNLSPQNGQPYNQLAILEVNRNNKLSSVFYYVRSLAVRHPFPAAATNLEKFYSKLIKDTSEFKGKMAQNEFVNAFLQFQALLHLAADFNRASYLCSRILSCLPAHLVSQTFSASVLVQCVAITIFTLNHMRHIPSGGDASVNVSTFTKSESRGGNSNSIDGTKTTTRAETLLSSDELKSVDIILGFTASVLELLVQHTPRLPAKVRESPTLPAIHVLIDWLVLSPDIISSPPFSNSNVWVHLSKLLNAVQQMDTDKPLPDLSKYEEAPLTEDTDLRCFQPIEKAHSKYSFSRLPVDGFPRGVEDLLRCQRLVALGKCIAEDFPEMKMTALQQNDSLHIQFLAPYNLKGSDGSHSPQDRRAKQNVAMQAIMKQGQNDQTDMTRVGSEKVLVQSVLGQSPPKYLLGTITSEPQFMKYGGTASSSSSNGSGNGDKVCSGNMQTSPQPSQSPFSHPGTSPQSSSSSPLQAPPTRIVAHMQGPVLQPRVASPHQIPPQQQQQQQASPPQMQQKQLQQIAQKQNIEQTTQQMTPQMKQQVMGSQSGSFSSWNPQAMSARFSPSIAHSAPIGPAPGAQHPFPGHVSTSTSYQGQGHIQGQIPQTHPSQSHAYQGQRLPSAQASRMDTPSTNPSGPTPGQPGQFSTYPFSFPGGRTERFTMPTPGMGPLVSAGTQPDGPRMPHFPSGQASSAASGGGAIGGGPNMAQSSMHSQGIRAFNQEMLSALRLASQMTQLSQQQHAQHAPLGMGPQSSQQQPLPVQHEQAQHQHHQQQNLIRASGQRAPALGHVSAMGHVPAVGHVSGMGPSSTGGPTFGPFSNPNLRPAFHSGAGMNFPQGPRENMQNPPLSHSYTQPHAPLQGPLPIGGQRGHEMGVGQVHPRPPVPPIPMPGHHAIASSGFPTLAQQLFSEDGSNQRNDPARFQGLSLAIQPPKLTPSDTRITTSFQGHAEGTPKPDKAETFAPEKREPEPVIRRVEMPVAQPSGEYSLFASSSPWSMSLNSGTESKSSQFSSQESSIRSSPIIGFETAGSATYDSSIRYRTSAQGSGYQDKIKGQQSFGAPTLWADAPAMTPLERLLEQQRLQRQTDPH